MTEQARLTIHAGRDVVALVWPDGAEVEMTPAFLCNDPATAYRRIRNGVEAWQVHDTLEQKGEPNRAE